MKDLFTVNGRYNRLKYFGYSFLLNILMGFLQLVVGNSDNLVVLLLIMALVIVAAYVSICITVKRFHDLGRPGTHYFLLLIPFYNIYLALVLLFKKGDTGVNAYGEDPLA